MAWDVCGVMCDVDMAELRSHAFGPCWFKIRSHENEAVALFQEGIGHSYI